MSGTTDTTYTYDAVGERHTETEGLNGQTTFSYDQGGALESISGLHAEPGVTSASYSYNGDGLRQSKTVGGSETTEVYDTVEPVPAMIEDGDTAYVTGPDGLPVERISASGAVSFYSHDQLGSTTALTNPAGQTIATYQYSAYGQVVSHTGTDPNPFQYAGQYTDAESGLQYLRARYYDPSSGQMLTRDPIAAATLAPYSYASDDAIDGADPSGLCGTSSVGAVINCVNPFAHPHLVDAVAAGVCAIPFADIAACGPAIAVAVTVSVVADAYHTISEYPCNVGHNLAEGGVDLVLALGGSLAGAGADLAEGAGIGAELILRAPGAILSISLDVIRAAQAEPQKK